MRTVTSRDGTIIAFDQFGEGPALILVGGTFEQRAMDSETSRLAGFPLLIQHFTVFHYDRRGRGDSTDTQPYAVEREVEDIEALINVAGGSALIFGISSGAALALEATLALTDRKVKKLAMYEPPYFSDKADQRAWIDYREQLEQVLAEDRRGDAVALWMSTTGMPKEQVAEMRQYPLWPMWEAVAPTLAYDAAVMGKDFSIPVERVARFVVPTLIMDGSESYPFMHIAASALANVIPGAQHRTLEGQTHEVAADALAPVLVEFFTQNSERQ